MMKHKLYSNTFKIYQKQILNKYIVLKLEIKENYRETPCIYVSDKSFYFEIGVDMINWREMFK